MHPIAESDSGNLFQSKIITNEKDAGISHATKKPSEIGSFFQVSGHYRVFILYRDFPMEPV